MAKRDVVLKVSGLSRRYGETTIIDGFDLTVRRGEAVALVGRNGAGKSTVLRCLVGADKPTDGTIEINGETLSETSVAIRRDLATVIDDLDFFPDLSVVEHLDLLARAHGVENPEEVVDEVLHEVGLVPQSGQLPGTLSSGQRRRLALGTAFVRPRSLLVLDEPEQRLDVDGVTWLGERLASEVADGLALVFASHEPRLIDQVATRIVRIGEADPDPDEADTEPGPVGKSAHKDASAHQQPPKNQKAKQPSKHQAKQGKGRRRGGRR